MQFSSDNARGAAYMVAGMVGYVLNDMMIKLVSADLGLFQAIFLRGVFTSLFIGGLAWHRGEVLCRLARKDWVLLALRTFGELGATICFLTALFNMPIANATAIMQAMPLAVTLAAALFLGESVGWRRYGAITIGFIGVLIIVRPGGEGFNVYALWAVAALFFLVLRDLSTRRFSAQLPSVFAVFVASLAITAMGAILSPGEAWRPVEGPALLMLAAAAFFLFFGYIFCALAMRVGEIGFVSPFRYTILVWAIVIGFVVFGDLPDALTLIGSLIVVGMGIYTFYRERHLKAAQGHAGGRASGRTSERAPLVADSAGPSTRP